MSYFIDGYEWPYSVYSGITEILIFERNGSALKWIGSRPMDSLGGRSSLVDVKILIKHCALASIDGPGNGKVSGITNCYMLTEEYIDNRFGSRNGLTL